ncbi:MAG: diaminopimelate epimerase [Alphaproteobacteria bacterium]
MRFLKMHGLGNDFVIFDARTEMLALTEADMVEIADRRRGVGCDLITVIEASDNADVFVQFFNADGSESGACGNATRCVADIVMSETEKDTCTIEVLGGILNCRKKGDLMIEVDMGVPKDVNDLDIGRDGVSNPVYVDMGNPHCVFFVDNYQDISVDELGAHFETHDAFPNRSNVEFIIVQDRGHVRQKTWERGCGLTEACGSGACAVIAAAVRRGLTDHKVDVELDGGILHMELREGDGHVLMTGPVAYVFDGEL